MKDKYSLPIIAVVFTVLVVSIQLFYNSTEIKSQKSISEIREITRAEIFVRLDQIKTHRGRWWNVEDNIFGGPQSLDLKHGFGYTSLDGLVKIGYGLEIANNLKPQFKTLRENWKAIDTHHLPGAVVKAIDEIELELKEQGDH